MVLAVSVIGIFAGSWSLPDGSIYGCERENLPESLEAVESSFLQTAPVHKVTDTPIALSLEKFKMCMSIFRYGKTPNPDQMKASGGFCPICQDAYQVPMTLSSMTLSLMTFSWMTFSWMKFSWMRFPRRKIFLEDLLICTKLLHNLKAITVLFDRMICNKVMAVRQEGKGQNMF